MMTRFLAVSTVVLLAAAPSGAMATNQQQQSFAVWKGEDNCAREAFRQFPDHTPESNAKRDEAMRRCLDRQQLPPRTDLSRPPHGTSEPSTRH
jgi:hypothetical protein